MNKKLLSVFFAVLLCVVVSVPAFADTAEGYTPHLIDNADPVSYTHLTLPTT